MERGSAREKGRAKERKTERERRERRERKRRRLRPTKPGLDSIVTQDLHPIWTLMKGNGIRANQRYG